MGKEILGPGVRVLKNGVIAQDAGIWARRREERIEKRLDHLPKSGCVSPFTILPGEPISDIPQQLQQDSSKDKLH